MITLLKTTCFQSHLFIAYQSILGLCFRRYTSGTRTPGSWTTQTKMRDTCLTCDQPFLSIIQAAENVDLVIRISDDLSDP